MTSPPHAVLGACTIPCTVEQGYLGSGYPWEPRSLLPHTIGAVDRRTPQPCLSVSLSLLACHHDRAPQRGMDGAVMVVGARLREREADRAARRSNRAGSQERACIACDGVGSV